MKTFLSIWLVFLVFGAQAQKINFQSFNSLEEVFEVAKKEDKLILIDTYADWCGWCKFMDENVFNQQSVSQYYNEHFVSFKVDTEEDHSLDFTIEYEVSGLPCILILNDKGETLNRSDGAITKPEEFISFGKMGYYKHNPETSPWHQNQKEFDAGNREPKFLKEYAMSMIDGDYSEQDIQKVVDLYWKNSNTKSITDTTNFEMFYLFTNQFDDPLLEQFILNKAEMIAFSDEEMYYDKIVMVLQHNLDESIASNNEAQYKKCLVFAENNLQDQEVYEYDKIKEVMELVWEDREN